MVVALLTIFTCGLYALYWQYKTTDELKAITGKDLNPGLEVLLSVVTCGIFSIYAHYRNAQLVTKPSTPIGLAEGLDYRQTVLRCTRANTMCVTGWLRRAALSGSSSQVMPSLLR
ncbi:MAG: DUF4234 domain-containing protein [Myxococcales bacterium]|nr:DUF4234 domain-containing protein [Myxococcales bacterium]